MSILAHGGGTSGATASIFVTGLTSTDTVTATKDGKTWNGAWTTKTITIEQPLVPTMTSDTTPSGTCFEKSTYDSGGAAWKAFQGSPTYGTQAHSSADTSNWYIGYAFTESVTVTSWEICPQGSNGYVWWDRFPSSFILQGSNDGSTWIDIQTYQRTWSSTTISASSFSASDTLSFDVDNPQEFIRYRVYWGTSTGYSTCSYVQFYGYKTETVSGHLISNLNSYGTYTVTATDGTHTATESVLVDVATEYDVGMSYLVYLYNEGDKCEDVTGGWTVTASGASVTWNNTYLTYVRTGSPYGQLETIGSIDLTNYSTLNFTVTRISGYLYWQISDYALGGRVNTVGTHSADISSYTSSHRVLFPNDPGLTCDITQIWLE